ncbi:LysR family transcriptional regulator [Actinomadura madurae]|uniref:LysR family transcriptional regulator n=1 Tax=Actinomadura madurae TaxID=1993 RepID=UPI0020D24648|nr:LysR family transcriptional regulator [Actinomadura madurae]MCP9949798.1 LysR family transcriptional regulator [Actinomadura madurae]MCP9979040.1 LysR family transcriptional regulator [Actinomadura madurae]MCQ0009434.1 LysR family transcriptional regulator [Actinomadura madurae]
MRVERARYFLAAIETGSLRAAAARCGVSQPTIGQQIALLEEELDVVLLTRSRHGVRPTAAGQALIEPLGRLVAAEDAVRESAMESGAAYHGRVRIGGVSVTAETIIAPVVGGCGSGTRGCGSPSTRAPRPPSRPRCSTGRWTSGWSPRR